jgi:hypothetical protein
MLKNIVQLIKILELEGILIPFTSLFNSCSVKWIFHSKLSRTMATGRQSGHHSSWFWPKEKKTLCEFEGHTVRRKNKEESCRNRLFPINSLYPIEKQGHYHRC